MSGSTTPLNAFATEAFLAFAVGDGQGVAGAGVVALDSASAPFPYLIVERANALFPGGARFLVTPICLCGPARLDLEAALPEIEARLADQQLAGGFVQTRAAEGGAPGFVAAQGWCAHLDSRTDYRLPLGLAEDDLLARMKRDSRTRTRKLLRHAAAYRVVEAGTDGVDRFAAMYADVAESGGFAPAYRFSPRRWQALMAGPGWQLYLLELRGRVVAGAVVARVEGGFDYTFMAYDGDVPDASRANILFLYRHLSAAHTGCLDLGGGIVEDDALARFKLGMGGGEQAMRRLRFAFLADTSLELARQSLAARFP